MSEPAADYFLDNYGTCGRDQPARNDCYWGKNDKGEDNGCLKTGWRGRGCPHWKPLGATSFDEMREVSR